jgi:hypothetical protein
MDNGRCSACLWIGKSDEEDIFPMIWIHQLKKDYL